MTERSVNDMPKFSRTTKYKTLHDQIAMDTAIPLNPSNGPLVDYSRQINNINPAIISEDAINNLDQTLQHLDEVIEHKPDFSQFTGPMGIVSGSYPSAKQERSNPAQRQVQKAVPYPPEEPAQTVKPAIEQPEPEPLPKEQPPVYEAEDEPPVQKTAQSIRAEMEQMLNEVQADSHVSRTSCSDSVTNSLLLETRELKKQIDERSDEISTVEKKIHQTNQMINGMLWVMIITLGAVLLAVVYMIIQRM